MGIAMRVPAMLLLVGSLAACGGGAGNGDAATQAGGSALLPEAATWTECAAEGHVCEFTGTREVRYGADGTYVFKTVTGPVACSDDIFGDPLPGAAKSCSHGAPVAAPAAAGWTIVDLGTLGGQETIAADINEAGDIVGTSTLANGSRRAFLYRSGRMTDLGTLAGDDGSSAVAINNLGQVAGSSGLSASGVSRIFTYDDGRMSEAALPFGAAHRVRDINDAGDVLVNYYHTSHGGCTSPNPGCNYIFRKNARHLDLQGQIATGREISNAGVVLAHAGNSREPTVLYNIHDGSRITIGAIPGGPVHPYHMAPDDMNDTGEVVGHSGYGRPFIYKNGTVADINTVIDGAIASLSGMNDRGDIAGTLRTDTGSTVFLAANGGKAVDLNSLAAVRQANWTLESVTRLNNARQMIGQGIDAQGRRRAFLLTPG